MPPPSCTAADGTLLGHLIVDTAEAAEKPERASAVRTFVERTATLRESGVGCLDALAHRQPWARAAMTVLPQAVETSTPGALTVQRQRRLAVGFDAIIRSQRYTAPMRSTSCFESTRQ